jgi:hypothetical protein
LGLLALGCIVFGLSKAYDEAHRGALLGIIAILFALHFLGQALRRPPKTPPPAEPVSHEPISADRTVFALVLAWLVPGLGHWVIGRRAKAVLFFTVITTTFLAGVFLAHGRNLDIERDSIYFWAYGWNGVETLLAWFFAQGLKLDHEIPHLLVGFPYSSVAGLLNVVVMMDVLTTGIRSEEAATA